MTGNGRDEPYVTVGVRGVEVDVMISSWCPVVLRSRRLKKVESVGIRENANKIDRYRLGLRWLRGGEVWDE